MIVGVISFLSSIVFTWMALSKSVSRLQKYLGVALVLLLGCYGWSRFVQEPKKDQPENQKPVVYKIDWQASHQSLSICFFKDGSFVQSNSDFLELRRYRGHYKLGADAITMDYGIFYPDVKHKVCFIHGDTLVYDGIRMGMRR